MTEKNENTTLLSVTENIRVNFYDADPLGIVWHGNYLKYFEVAREAFGRKYNLSYLHIKEEGYASPIIKTTTEHKLPLKYGDIATVKIEFVNTLAAKMIFNYTILNNLGKLICKGETIQVFTDILSGELSIINPEFYSKWKAKNGLSVE